MQKHSLLLFVVMSFIMGCDLTSHEEYYDRALEFDRMGDYKQALYNMNRALEKRPNDRISLFNRAEYKIKLNDTLGALKDYLTILEFDPDNTLVLCNIASYYNNLGDYKTAIKYYNKALESPATKTWSERKGSFDFNYDPFSVDPDNAYEMYDVDILLKRGTTYRNAGRLDWGIRDFDYLLEVNYQPMYSHHFLGLLFLDKHDTIQACQHFVESAKLGAEVSRELLKKHCIPKE